MKNAFCFFCLWGCFAAEIAFGQPANPVAEWTINGAPVKAAVLGVDGQGVLLRREDGKEARLPASAFTAPERGALELALARLLGQAVVVTALTNVEPKLEIRDWTNRQGKTVRARLSGFDSSMVMLVLENQVSTTVPHEALSSEDLNYISMHVRALLTPSVASSAPSLTGALPVRKWPTTLTAPDGLTNAYHHAAASKVRQHVYRSKRFEYVVHAEAQLSLALMKDVARVFEGTYELLANSPIGVHAQPVEGYFRAHLYDTRQAYTLAGGPPLSGGVYSSKDRVFRVPLESLGIKMTGRVYGKTSDFEPDTLVHEITHMLMHDLLPFLPRWLAEGVAEYVECMPFKNGTFVCNQIEKEIHAYNQKRFNDGDTNQRLDILLKEMQPSPEKPPQSIAPMGPRNFVPAMVIPTPESIEAQIREQRAYYHGALLLTYYFLHLEGEGQGGALSSLLQAAKGEGTRAAEVETAFERYKQEFENFKKLPGVTDLGGGRVQYPSNLTPPKEPELPSREYKSGGNLAAIHGDKLMSGRSFDEVAQMAETRLEAAQFLVRKRPRLAAEGTSR